MKKLIKIFIIVLGIFIVFIVGLILRALSSKQGRIILPVKHKNSYQNENLSQFPSRLHVQGNEILNANNERIVFKGIMAPDPQKLDFKKKFNKTYYVNISKTGANVIRIPVHPDRWINDKDYLWRHLDPIVTWAGESNMYVIIDLHYIGNIATGYGNQMPHIKEKPMELAVSFWKQIADYFKDTPNVVFEIYNEPADINTDDWFKNASDVVRNIRETGAKQLIVVGGIDYAYDISWVENKPIADNNVAYASHVYPSRKNWDIYFGDISEKYPVIVTEWGFMDENRSETKQTYLIGDEKSFGAPFLQYLNDRNIGWVACWYDNEWEPPMFQKNYKDYTNFGRFVFQKLRNR